MQIGAPAEVSSDAGCLPRGGEWGLRQNELMVISQGPTVVLGVFGDISQP